MSLLPALKTSPFSCCCKLSFECEISANDKRSLYLFKFPVVISPAPGRSISLPLCIGYSFSSFQIHPLQKLLLPLGLALATKGKLREQVLLRLVSIRGEASALSLSLCLIEPRLIHRANLLWAKLCPPLCSLKLHSSN